MDTNLKLNNCSLILTKGDITDLKVDVIVNAANSQLQLGLGVAGAIARKGGSSIQRECDKLLKKIGNVPVGEAVLTSGGNLNARYVIHSIGPYGTDQKRDILLSNAVKNSLRVAGENTLQSIAIPAISTGIYGFPIEQAAVIILSTIINWLKKHDSSLETIFVCLYDSRAFAIFLQTLTKIKRDL